MTRPSDTVVVVAHWQTAPDTHDDVRALTTELRSRTLEEPGCVGYEIYQSADDANTIVLVERYRDRSAMEAHQASRHYQELAVSRIRPMLTDRRVELLQSLS
jgi:quinol monooxygenase YgiN